MKLGPTEGKNKDFACGHSAAQSLEIAPFTLNRVRSLFRTRRGRHQTQIEIARIERILIVAQCRVVRRKRHPETGRQIALQQARALELVEARQDLADSRRISLPLSAADPVFYGTWKVRPSGVPDDRGKQVQTITQVADGIKVNTEIDFGNGTGMSLSYTTKLDGAEVPVYSAGKVVMTIRAKKTGPNTYEGTTSANGTTSQFKTTINANGKVMTSESIDGPIKGQSVFDRVN